MIWPSSWLKPTRSWMALFIKIQFFTTKRVSPKSKNVGYVWICIYIYIRIHQCIFKGGILTSWNSSWRSHIFSQVGARARLRIPSANRRSLQNWKLAPWFHDVPRHVRTKFWEFVWDGFEESVGNSSGVWILSPKVGWCETLWNILKHCETLWNSGTFNNPCSL